MSFERNAEIDGELVPCRAESITVSDGNIPPKLRRITAVLTNSGKRITTDIPSMWAKFIAHAINTYWDMSVTSQDGLGRTLVKMIVSGEPRQKDDSREVVVDTTGRYRIKRTSIYNSWVARAKRELKRSVVYKQTTFPIAFPCNVCCTFYVTPRKRAIPLGDLLASALDLLWECGVLSEVASTVKSMDGSRIKVDGQPRIEVVIKEIKE